MRIIKHLLVVGLLGAACLYLAVVWQQHAAFVDVGGKLLKKHGLDIVQELRQANAGCSGYAVFDSAELKSDWPLADKGIATLYISGKGGRSVSVDYRVEAASDKVYVKPIDAAKAQLDIYRFAINDCG